MHIIVFWIIIILLRQVQCIYQQHACYSDMFHIMTVFLFLQVRYQFHKVIYSSYIQLPYCNIMCNYIYKPVVCNRAILGLMHVVYRERFSEGLSLLWNNLQMFYTFVHTVDVLFAHN